MKQDEDAKPTIDSTGKGLGVRDIVVNGVADIDVDQNGLVVRNQKGMSVAPTWRDLPIHLIPKRLRLIFPGARGSSLLYCFVHGEGEFVSGLFAPSLELWVDDTTHANVIPIADVTVPKYQSALANTRAGWSVDEL